MGCKKSADRIKREGDGNLTQHGFEKLFSAITSSKSLAIRQYYGAFFLVLAKNRIFKTACT